MNKLELVPVVSSQISAIGFDPENKRCRIQFAPHPNGEPGAIYEYENVEPADFEALKNAPSVGSHFLKNIKQHPAKFPYRKLESVNA